ncbi:MAG: septal ring lytic transglycosylase RlpA family protein [Gammaproteobacteria bacterium]|nr:septal ring lytic transglycosylase RlpA family protein [Gammaproteobacteria bacterium]MDE2272594.1 septal ring lytic transglycosylase RlpA family protein [Gammaproteobacteria bacterium]
MPWLCTIWRRASARRAHWRARVRCPEGCAALAALLLLAGCAQFPTQDHGPANPVDLSRIPNATPQYVTPSRYGNQSPYTVNGETYTLLPSCVGYHDRGIASWYGTKFHGGRTSDGETYDMFAMTAASKVLPLPCYVRVTNLQNGQSVIVKVNDRGPFVANRIIDLSYAAAARIGMIGTGTALVDVTAVTPGEPQPPTGPGSNLPPPAGATPAPAATGTAGQPQLFVQVGAFATESNAARVLARLRAAAVSPAFILPELQNGITLYKVRIGPIPDVTRVDALTAQLGTLGFGDAQVVIP